MLSKVRRAISLGFLMIASLNLVAAEASTTYKIYVAGTGDAWTDCSNGVGGNCVDVPGWAWGRTVDLALTDYSFKDVGAYYSMEQWECPDGVSCRWVYLSSGYFCKQATVDVAWQATRIKVRVSTIAGYLDYCYSGYNPGIPTAGLISATFR